MPKNGELSQWGWTELEELLQCPVCLEPPSGVVEQCKHGHHICANCKPQLDNCPLCKCNFEGTRNFVVEELIRHFDELRNTMLLNNISSDTEAKMAAKSKLNATAPVFTPKSVFRRRTVGTPELSRGLYPCRIGDCGIKLPLSRLLNHVRCYHQETLTESIIDATDCYNQTWEIPYVIKKPLTKTVYTVFVSGMGLFFLTTEILHSGELIVVIQMALSYTKAQNILASLRLFSESITYTHSSRAVSVRSDIATVLEQRKCFTLSKKQMKNLCTSKKFSCKLRLSRFDFADFSILTDRNSEQIALIAGKRLSLLHEATKKKPVCPSTSNNVQPAQKKNTQKNLRQALENGLLGTQRNETSLENNRNRTRNNLANGNINGVHDNNGNRSQQSSIVTVGDLNVSEARAPTSAQETQPVAGQRRNNRRRNRVAIRMGMVSDFLHTRN